MQYIQATLRKNFFSDHFVNENYSSDRSGNITSRAYILRMPYVYKINYTLINNHDKKTLCFGSIKKGEIFTIKETRNIYETWSKTFSSESDLAVAISNIEKTKIQIVQNTVNPMCAGLNYSFKNEFTQIHRQVSAHFIRLDEDDFYEHYFYLKYMNDLKTILEKMTENQGIEQYMPELKPIIDYLESLVYKYETTLISQKMAAASYYNIGLIYYYLDMPEETLL